MPNTQPTDNPTWRRWGFSLALVMGAGFWLALILYLK